MMKSASQTPFMNTTRSSKLALFAFVCVVVLAIFLSVRTSTDRAANKLSAPESQPRLATTKEGHLAIGESGKPNLANKLTTEATNDPAKSNVPSSGQPTAGNAEQQSLWQAFHDAQHDVQTPTAREAAIPENKGVRHFIANPAQDLTARFMEDGARLQSGQPGKSWQGTLRLQNTSSARTRTLHAAGARVEYRSDGITEWYENRSEGIEHGFTLTRRPADATSSGFALTLALDGLHAEKDDTGGARLVDPKVGPVASYSTLKVWDADGKALAANIVPLGNAIALHVTDIAARYPVTIDPFITSLEQKFVPEISGDGAAGDEFGRAVAISGDTVVIGAYADDTTSGSNAGSAYVFVRSGVTWSLQAKLTANDGAASDQFGWCVSMDVDTVLIGAPMDDLTAGANVGSAYLFVRSGTTWSLPTRITAADGAVSDQFGWAVSVHGQTALVGASLDDTVSGTDAGSAYVFTLSGGSWLQQAKITAADGAGSDNFGYSVSLETDTCLVGAYLDDTTGGTNAGSAYVFVRSSNVWSQQAQLQAPDGAANDQFGISVSLSSESALIAAAFDDTIAGGVDSGSASIFVRTAATWSFEVQLIADDIQPGDVFGYEVSLSGSTALIGAVDGDNSPGSLSGCAYIFTRNGSSWSQQAKLVEASGLYNDQFGVRVALSGNTAVIGANFKDTDAGLNSGCAYVYARTGSNWSLQSQLNAGNDAAGDRFGVSVDIEGDTAVVGSQYADTLAGGNSGLAYVFIRSGAIWMLETTLLGSDVSGGDEFSGVAISGGTIAVAARYWGANQGAVYIFIRGNGVWIQQGKLLADDGAASDSFGYTVAIDGDTVLVGAGNDDTTAGVDAGSAYVFVRNNGVWAQQAHLFASDGAANETFGTCSISGDTAIVGVWQADTVGGIDAGKAYVFVRNGITWSQQAILLASDGLAGDVFGYQVRISGDTALISAHGNDTVAGASAGSAYVFVRSGAVWAEQTILAPTDPASGDQFSHSCDLQGDTVVIGAWSDDTAAGGNAGSAYIFSRSGGVWTQQSKLTAPDAAANDYFSGYSVALDGDTILISTYLDSTTFPSFLPGFISSGHGSVYVFRFSDVEIAVEEPVGANLANGSASLFGDLNIGASTPAKTFTIRNSGTTHLMGVAVTKSGSNQTDFQLNTGSLTSTVPPGGTTTFFLTFAPSVAGNRSAVIQIASNDVDENPFEVTLSGQAYSSTTDTDSDGMNDWQEVLLTSLGFNWQVNQAALVNTYFTTASQNGLYTQSQLQALHVGTPMITRDPLTQQFKLTIGIQKSTNLINFGPFPILAPGLTVNPQSKIEYRFTVPDNAAFFLLQAN